MCAQGSTMESIAEAASGDATNSDAYWYFIYLSALIGLLTLVFISLAAKKQLDRLIEASPASNQAGAGQRGGGDGGDAEEETQQPLRLAR